MDKTKPVAFGGIGFINPLYDYQLLFDTLEKIDHPWSFTWIGGLRSDEQQPLFASINRLIEQHQWQSRFSITGWVSEEILDQRLASIDIIFALFTQRSSSASIARALGARRPVLTTRLPLTEEIAAFNTKRGIPSPLVLCESSPEKIADNIENIITDRSILQTLEVGIDAYIDTCSYPKMAHELVKLYKEQLEQ